MGNENSSCIVGDPSIMSQKEYGTSSVPIQDNLRWNTDGSEASSICNHNRHFAETSGYFTGNDEFMKEIRSLEQQQKDDPSLEKTLTFYDSNTGNPLFEAPKGRTWEDFIDESIKHGWPSFRDEEVIWDNVRCMKNGETVSIQGTHLGHDLPDKQGSRHCINLICIAGNGMPDSGNSTHENGYNMSGNVTNDYSSNNLESYQKNGYMDVENYSCACSPSPLALFITVISLWMFV